MNTCTFERDRGEAVERSISVLFVALLGLGLALQSNCAIKKSSNKLKAHAFPIDPIQGGQWAIPSTEQGGGIETFAFPLGLGLPCHSHTGPRHNVANNTPRARVPRNLRKTRKAKYIIVNEWSNETESLWASECVCVWAQINQMHFRFLSKPINSHWA